jgi:hypothetical protein
MPSNEFLNSKQELKRINSLKEQKNKIALLKKINN